MRGTPGRLEGVIAQGEEHLWRSKKVRQHGKSLLQYHNLLPRWETSWHVQVGWKKVTGFLPGTLCCRQESKGSIVSMYWVLPPGPTGCIAKYRSWE